MPIVRTTADASIFSEPIVANRFWQWTEELRKRGWSLARIAKRFPYPSPLARLTMLFRSRDLWTAPTGVQPITVYNRLASLLAVHYRGKPFTFDGKNLLWASKDIRRNLRTWRPNVDHDDLASLNGRLWLYTEMIFSHWHNLGHEYHGPYQYRGERYLVKDWHDLQGLGFRPWNHFPYRHIRTVENIGSARVRIDLHNRLEMLQKSDDKQRGALEIDGRPATPRMVARLRTTLDSYLVRGAKELAALTPMNVKIIEAFMECYAVRPLADALGEDWRPPRSLIQRIKQKRLGLRERQLLNILHHLYTRMNRATIALVYSPVGSILGSGKR